jgi:hypothetical protein
MKRTAVDFQNQQLHRGDDISTVLDDVDDILDSLNFRRLFFFDRLWLLFLRWRIFLWTLAPIVCFRPEFVPNELLERCAVPAILDVIFRSAGVEELGGNLDPPLAKLFVAIPKKQVVFSGEGQMVDFRIEMIDPSITNLFSNATRKSLGKVGPPRKWLLG